MNQDKPQFPISHVKVTRMPEAIDGPLTAESYSRSKERARYSMAKSQKWKMNAFGENEGEANSRYRQDRMDHPGEHAMSRRLGEVKKVKINSNPVKDSD